MNGAHCALCGWPTTRGQCDACGSEQPAQARHHEADETAFSYGPTHEDFPALQGAFVAWKARNWSRMVTACLESLGVRTPAYRNLPFGQGWAFVQKSAAVYVYTDSNAGILAVESPVVQLPTLQRVPLMRRLLEMNAGALGAARFCLRDSTVVLRFTDTLVNLDPPKLCDAICDVALLADKYDNILSVTYSARMIGPMAQERNLAWEFLGSPRSLNNVRHVALSDFAPGPVPGRQPSTAAMSAMSTRTSGAVAPVGPAAPLQGGWLDRVARSIVNVRAGKGEGTGWIGLSNGMIVTNVHVIGFAPRVTIRLHDGTDVDGRVVYADTKQDIAFVAPARPLGIAPLPLGDSTAIALGEPVTAIGHPLGLAMTVTRGVVSAPSREVRGVHYIQTDAALNPGNSGGPLVNDAGQALGVNTWIRADGQNLGFSVPVDAFADALARHEVSLQELQTYRPEYRCVECEQPFDMGFDACLSCGAPMPFAGGYNEQMFTQQYARSERLVGDLIQRLGYNSAQTRTDKGAWTLPREGNRRPGRARQHWPLRHFPRAARAFAAEQPGGVLPIPAHAQRLEHRAMPRGDQSRRCRYAEHERTDGLPQRERGDVRRVHAPEYERRAPRCVASGLRMPGGGVGVGGDRGRVPVPIGDGFVGCADEQGPSGFPAPTTAVGRYTIWGMSSDRLRWEWRGTRSAPCRFAASPVGGWDGVCLILGRVPVPIGDGFVGSADEQGPPVPRSEASRGEWIPRSNHHSRSLHRIALYLTSVRRPILPVRRPILPARRPNHRELLPSLRPSRRPADCHRGAKTR